MRFPEAIPIGQSVALGEEPIYEGLGLRGTSLLNKQFNHRALLEVTSLAEEGRIQWILYGRALRHSNRAF